MQSNASGSRHVHMCGSDGSCIAKPYGMSRLDHVLLFQYQSCSFSHPTYR
jgi:hypothetical protein